MVPDSVLVLGMFGHDVQEEPYAYRPAEPAMPNSPFFAEFLLGMASAMPHQPQAEGVLWALW